MARHLTVISSLYSDRYGSPRLLLTAAKRVFSDQSRHQHYWQGTSTGLGLVTWLLGTFITPSRGYHPFSLLDSGFYLWEQRIGTTLEIQPQILGRKTQVEKDLVNSSFSVSCSALTFFNRALKDPAMAKMAAVGTWLLS